MHSFRLYRIGIVCMIIAFAPIAPIRFFIDAIVTAIVFVPAHSVFLVVTIHSWAFLGQCELLSFAVAVIVQSHCDCRCCRLAVTIYKIISVAIYMIYIRWRLVCSCRLIHSAQRNPRNTMKMWTLQETFMTLIACIFVTSISYGECKTVQIRLDPISPLTSILPHS